MRKTAGSMAQIDEPSSRSSASDGLNVPSRSGPIYCQTWGVFNRWRRFHCELMNHTLFITLIKGGMVKKSFKLHSNTVCEDNSTRPFCFQLRTPNTKEILLLSTDNIASKESWMESIQASLSLLRLADRKLRDKDKKKYHEEAVKEYITRPMIYFKVIRARNLTAKDNNGLSDPYVKITLGSSHVRTTTRKKNLNPDWGMVFSFDWEMSMRYAVVEVWDEDFSSADDFLGVVYIPVFSFYDGYTSKAWYPLGKRSQKSTVSGEIEIEISCSGQPDSDLLAWQFFNEVQKLPEFSINLVAQEDGSGQIGLKNVFVKADSSSIVSDNTPRASIDFARPVMEAINDQAILNGDNAASATEYLTNGFPLFYPSIELETLEDISLNSELMVTINNKKIFNDGALLLTSHRLIFISLRRILAERNMDLLGGSNNLRDTITSLAGTNANDSGVRLDSSDLSVQIYLSTISSIALVSEADSSDAAISYDAIKLKTCDCRNFSFLFKDDCAMNILPNAGNIFNKAIDHIFGSSNEISLKRRPTNTGIEQTLLSVSPKTSVSPFYEGADIFSGKNISADNRRKQSVLQSYNQSADSSIAVLSQYGNLSQLEVAWLNIVRGNQARSIEATEAVEGPPAHRIVGRIKNKSVNRGIERYRLLVEHYELINDTRTACNLGGVPPPSMYDLEIRLSEKPIDPNAIYLNGIPRSNSEFLDNDRLSAANTKSSLSGISNLTGANRNSESSAVNPSDLPASSNPVHLPLGWTNSVTEDHARPSTSVGNLKRRNSSLTELIKRLGKSEGIRSNFTKLLFNLEAAWRVYDAAVEYRRMGVPNEKWRITTANSQYELCFSYPSVIAVPATIDDDTLTRAASFRSKNRFPALCWVHPKSGASISRASQPLAGLTNNRNSEDEKIIAEINKCVTPYDGATNSVDHQNSFIIIDARPLLNAKAQQAVGKGVENDKNYENTSILFMDIPNIHAVRKSLECVDDAIYDEANFHRNLEASQWQYYLYRILIAINRIVHCVHRENISILVHCSDGWDRTSQLTSLSLLLLDDYYRTVDGFIVLIEKEWISFGHKFADRLGWTQDGWKDEERSPIFFQFLNCIYEYIHQLPNVFEFNSQLLYFLAEHSISGLFSNFFFNNEYELKECQPWQYSISIWSAVLANRSSFINPNYSRQEAAVIPVITRGKIVFWEEWFFRWHDRVWLNQWIYFNDTDIKKKDIVWAEDHATILCAKCEAKFNMFRRRHHCRCCGQIFCDPCTREARVIPAISRWRTVRCCEECAEAIDLTQAEINETRRTTRKTDNSLHVSKGMTSN